MFQLDGHQQERYLLVNSGSNRNSLLANMVSMFFPADFPNKDYAKVSKGLLENHNDRCQEQT